MSIRVLSCFPPVITAGDTLKLQLSFGDYPATDWTALLKLNQPGNAVVSISGTASDRDFLFTVTSVITEQMVKGQWTWAVRVTETSSNEVTTAQAGDFVVLANYAGTVAKSAAQLQLDAANTAFAKLIASPRQSVSFNGQNFNYANKSELLGIIDRLQAKVDRENAEAAGLRGDGPTRSIRPYFV